MSNDERIAALERELAEIKLAQPKPQPSAEEEERARREHDAEMHAIRERNASHVPPWMRAACAGGVSDADARDLVHASHRPSGPTGMTPSTQMLTGIRPGGGPLLSPTPGWQAPRELGPPPGVLGPHGVDALCIADDIKQRSKR